MCAQQWQSHETKYWVHREENFPLSIVVDCFFSGKKKQIIFKFKVPTNHIQIIFF